MIKAEFAVAHGWTTNKRGPIWWIVSHVSRNPWIIVMMVVGAIGNAALASAIPIFTGRAFDAITGPTPNLQVLLWMAIAIVISQLIRAVLQLGRNFGSELLGQRLERDTRQELYASLMGKSMTFHELRPTGEVMARATNDVRELALMMAPGVNLVFGSGVFLVVPIVAAPAISPTLIVVPLIFGIAYVVAMIFYLRDLRPVTEEVRSSFGRMNAGLTAAMEGVETVKGAAQEDAEGERFAVNARAVREATVRQGRVEARFLPLLLLGVAQAAALWSALRLFEDGTITMGNVVAYMGLISLFGFPVFTSLFAWSQMSSGVASASRVLELIRGENHLDENRAGHAARVKGTVLFDDVTFGYGQMQEEGAEDGSSPALEEIAFSLPAGKTLALVGQTGSGKSTVGKLLNRTYDATSGRILVDGVDVRDWNLASLRQQISIIEQDIFLFSRTIAENIAFGRPGATRAEIEEAARAAQAHDFIESFPEGYETVVGERGVTLSGGQRQRIALARAFLTNPAILVLDDSTSAIDSATEDQIQRAIERVAHGRTTILITHRLSQIRWADQIVVLKKGRVVAAGNHDHLIATSQSYRDIFARF